MELLKNWRLAAGCFLATAIGAGSVYFYSAGLFMGPMSAEFGWSRGTASLGPLIVTLGYALAAPAIGWLIDRLGAARVGIASLIGLALAFVLLGVLVHDLLSYLLLMALLSLLSIGSTGVSFTRILVANFDRQRGLALGLALTGTGVGAIVLPPLLVPLIESYGWRATYFTMAGAILLALPLVAYLLGRGVRSSIAASAQAPRPADGDARNVGLLREPAFWRLGFLFLLASTGVFGTIVHFVPMLTDRGMSAVSAAAIASAIGIAVIGGRLATGALLDRFDPAWVAALLLALSGSGMAMLWLGDPAFAIPGALASGLAVGAEVDLLAYLVARQFPLSRYGAAFGGVFCFFLIGGALGPAIAGALYDWTGDYQIWLIVATACLLLAAAIALAGRGRPSASRNGLRLRA